MSRGRLGGVGRQRIGVVAQPADVHARLRHDLPDAVGLGLVEVVHVDVGHAGIAALGLPLRPAHQLHAGKALGGGELDHLLQRQVRQDGADESELHSRSLPGKVYARSRRLPHRRRRQCASASKRESRRSAWGCQSAAGVGLADRALPKLPMVGWTKRKRAGLILPPGLPTIGYVRCEKSPQGAQRAMNACRRLLSFCSRLCSCPG